MAGRGGSPTINFMHKGLYIGTKLSRNTCTIIDYQYIKAGLYRENWWRKNVRLSKETFEIICDELRPLIKRPCSVEVKGTYQCEDQSCSDSVEASSKC